MINSILSKGSSEQSRIKQLELQLAAMQQQRDFWTEQARTYQNQLQQVFATQASILDQLAKSAVCSEDVVTALDQMGEDLRRPLTTVAAVEALAASCRPGTQGEYTSRARRAIEGG